MIEPIEWDGKCSGHPAADFLIACGSLEGPHKLRKGVLQGYPLQTPVFVI